ncbi:MAG: hypothetical protein ACI4GW_08815 [Lachnospiraceae bacterium]
MIKSLALRFSENFAPEDGTISEHQKLIDVNGYVYYGKMGSAVSEKNINLILSQEAPKILLIHSCGIKRYWAYIDKISREQPMKNEFPDYYHDIADKFKTWFRIIRIEEVPKNIMARCKVTSSGAILGEASKHSMSPYFVIDCEE